MNNARLVYLTHCSCTWARGSRPNIVNPQRGMTLDVVNDVTSAADLVSLALKATSYVAVAFVSAASTDYFKSHLNRQKRMHFTVSQCREIINHLSTKHISRIGPSKVSHLTEVLDDIEQRLRLLAIEMQGLSLWGHIWGRSADDSIRRVESLVDEAEQDLRVSTKLCIIACAAVPLTNRPRRQQKTF
ncbi:hypothetical protein C2E23DRAFT_98296 [Lenzites betulinus]|nr:hypothetical protein C2E23DRAFT_98296 [Lenzites betulinus]